MENTIGTLSDGQMIDLINNKKLIVENFRAENVKQACYELTASNVYHDISNGNKKNKIEDSEYILIKPKQLIVIITKERLDIPNDILGRILSKGKLFSLGLFPINTYADPGFKGKIGIVFYNFSNDYLKIRPNDKIAKIEFSRLGHAVSSGYSGQHNYESEIWPIQLDMILTNDEIDRDPRIKNPRDEVRFAYGDTIGDLVDLVNKYSRRLMITSIIYITFSAILIFIISKTQLDINNYIAIFIGFISNLFFGISSLAWTKIGRRR